MSEGLILEELTKGGPARRCVATRTSLPAGTMIRFVVGPDAALVPDLAGRLPGRGMWIGAERAAVARAVSKNLFAKAARSQVRVGDDLPDRIEAMLVRRCLDLVGLARRAGGLVAGFDQVTDALRHGKVGLVLEARDASADGRRRVEAMAGGLPVVAAFDRRELGAAIGRDDIVHVALSRGGVQRRLIVELRRLKGFRAFSVPADDGGIGATSEERSRT